jgi:NhaP-type Na+/H+ or K+/H+ antiporter
MHEVLPSLVSIFVIGILAQWISWRLHLPSILLLLLLGILVGPVTGLIVPDELFGDLLIPIVSLSVALILYEGGLSLRLRELQSVGAVVRNLVTVGALVTWIGGTFLTRMLFGWSWSLALLTGALFIVTGPTVIGPMLRQIRPVGSVGPTLKWEGIVTDPLGVMVAVLVFESMLRGGVDTAFALEGVLLTVGVAGSIGFVGAWTLAFLLRRHLLPEFLQNPWSLMLVLVVFGACERIQPESGLFAVTVMGLVLANQRMADVRHIIEFKENLQVLLLSGIFVVLAARLEPDFLQRMSWRHLAFLGLMIIVVRPLSVALSTTGTSFAWRERIFLCCVAPRGIVSAAMASILALELSQRGIEEARELVPLAFSFIIGTVVIYGLGAPWVARALGLASRAHRGIVLLGAPRWGRALAQTLQASGADVLLVDLNRQHVSSARLEGLAAVQENILDERALEDLDLSGKGIFLALTPNDEVNALACLRMEELFGRSSVYQLVAQEESTGDTELDLGGRRLFGENVTYDLLARRHARGWRFKATNLTESFTLQHHRELYTEEPLPLFVIAPGGALRAIDLAQGLQPRSGERLVALVPPPSSAATAPT